MIEWIVKINQGVSILTGDAARLAKMKPPILIYITKSASWKAPDGGAISRNWCITHSRRGKAHYALSLHNQKCLLEGGRYVEKSFTFANWPFACTGADLN